MTSRGRGALCNWLPARWERGVMRPAITLWPGQREILRQALADAVFYRDPPVWCPVCEVEGALCEECAAGLARARAYLALGRTLGAH
jgi:hypothetical protein